MNYLISAILALSLPLSLDVQQTAPVRPPGTVAYISAQRISNESLDGQSGVKRVQALQLQKNGEIRALQQALEATRQQLAQTSDGGNRMPLQQQEQQQRAELERAAAQAQAELQKLQREIATELQAKIKAELSELVKGTDVQVVLQFETSIVWAAPGLDLTAGVIQRMNARTVAAGGGVSQ